MTDEKKLHLVTDRRVASDDVEPETEEQAAERAAKERHPSGYKLNPPPADVAEQLTRKADDVPPSTYRDVHTAFIVLVDRDGTVHVDTDLDQQIRVERPAHFYDFIGACHNVIIDVEASKNAQVALQHQMAVAAQLQQQAKNAELGLQVQQELERNKGRR